MSNILGAYAFPSTYPNISLFRLSSPSTPASPRFPLLYRMFHSLSSANVVTISQYLWVSLAVKRSRSLAQLLVCLLWRQTTQITFSLKEDLLINQSSWGREKTYQMKKLFMGQSGSLKITSRQGCAHGHIILENSRWIVDLPQQCQILEELMNDITLLTPKHQYHRALEVLKRCFSCSRNRGQMKLTNITICVL